MSSSEGSSELRKRRDVTGGQQLINNEWMVGYSNTHNNKKYYFNIYTNEAVWNYSEIENRGPVKKQQQKKHPIREPQDPPSDVGKARKYSPPTTDKDQDKQSTEIPSTSTSNQFMQPNMWTMPGQNFPIWNHFAMAQGNEYVNANYPNFMFSTNFPTFANPNMGLLPHYQCAPGLMPGPNFGQTYVNNQSDSSEFLSPPNLDASKYSRNTNPFLSTNIQNGQSSQTRNAPNTKSPNKTWIKMTGVPLSKRFIQESKPSERNPIKLSILDFTQSMLDTSDTLEDAKNYDLDRAMEKELLTQDIKALNIWESEPRSMKLQEGDLRLKLVAKRRTSTDRGTRSLAGVRKRTQSLGANDDYIHDNQINFTIKDEQIVDHEQAEDPFDNGEDSSNASLSLGRNLLQRAKPGVRTDRCYIVCDTNIYIIGLPFIKRMIAADTEDLIRILVPWKIHQELERIQKGGAKGSRQSVVYVQRRARDTIKFLYDESLKERKVLVGSAPPRVMQCFNPDDEILDCCMQYEKMNNFVVLVTNDKALLIKASFAKIVAFNLEQMQQMLDNVPPPEVDLFKLKIYVNNPLAKENMAESNENADHQNVEEHNTRMENRDLEKIPWDGNVWETPPIVQNQMLPNQVLNNMHGQMPMTSPWQVPWPQSVPPNVWRFPPNILTFNQNKFANPTETVETTKLPLPNVSEESNNNMATDSSRESTKSNRTRSSATLSSSRITSNGPVTPDVENKYTKVADNANRNHGKIQLKRKTIGNINNVEEKKPRRFWRNRLNKPSVPVWESQCTNALSTQASTPTNTTLPKQVPNTSENVQTSKNCVKSSQMQPESEIAAPKAFISRHKIDRRPQLFNTNSENRETEKEAEVVTGYCVESKTMHVRLLQRKEEWTCTFIQVMEDLLSAILWQGKCDYLLPPPWGLHEAAVSIQKMHENDTKIALKAGQFAARVEMCTTRNNLDSEKYDKRKKMIPFCVVQPSSPKNFMELFGQGMSLLTALKEKYENSEQLKQAEHTLTELAQDMRYAGRDSKYTELEQAIQDTELKIKIAETKENIDGDSRTDSKSTDEIIQIVKIRENRDFDIIEYLKKHYQEWECYTEDEVLKPRKQKSGTNLDRNKEKVEAPKKKEAPTQACLLLTFQDQVFNNTDENNREQLNNSNELSNKETQEVDITLNKDPKIIRRNILLPEYEERLKKQKEQGLCELDEDLNEVEENCDYGEEYYDEYDENGEYGECEENYACDEDDEYVENEYQTDDNILETGGETLANANEHSTKANENVTNKEALPIGGNVSNDNKSVESDKYAHFDDDVLDYEPVEGSHTEMDYTIGNDVEVQNSSNNVSDDEIYANIDMQDLHKVIRAVAVAYENTKAYIKKRASPVIPDLPRGNGDPRLLPGPDQLLQVLTDLLKSLHNLSSGADEDGTRLTSCLLRLAPDIGLMPKPDIVYKICRKNRDNLTDCVSHFEIMKSVLGIMEENKAIFC